MTRAEEEIENSVAIARSRSEPARPRAGKKSMTGRCRCIGGGWPILIVKTEWELREGYLVEKHGIAKVKRFEDVLAHFAPEPAIQQSSFTLRFEAPTLEHFPERLNRGFP
jgi:hypothetical protein